MMKALHIIMALVEAATGLALLIAPSLVIALLFATSLDTPTGLAVGRVAGAALFSLGIAFWFARNDGQSPSAFGLLIAMLFYNSAAFVILALAGAVSGLQGIALWPAVFFHAAMAVWCMACLLYKNQKNCV